MSISLIAGAIFVYFLIALIMIDWDTQLLPDDLTLSLLWIGLLFNIYNIFTSLENAVLGAVFGYMTFWVIFQLFKLITKKEGMGYGDFKLLSAISAWFGFKAIIPIILFSTIMGIIYYVFATKILKKELNEFAFGPYLGAAGIMYLFIGEPLVNMYLQLCKI